MMTRDQARDLFDKLIQEGRLIMEEKYRDWILLKKSGKRTYIGHKVQDAIDYLQESNENFL